MYSVRLRLGSSPAWGNPTVLLKHFFFLQRTAFTVLSCLPLQCYISHPKYSSRCWLQQYLIASSSTTYFLKNIIPVIERNAITLILGMGILIMAPQRYWRCVTSCHSKGNKYLDTFDLSKVMWKLNLDSTLHPALHDSTLFYNPLNLFFPDHFQSICTSWNFSCPWLEGHCRGRKFHSCIQRIIGVTAVKSISV